MTDPGRRGSRRLFVAAGLAALAGLVGPASAHGGGLGESARSSLTIPTWLVLVTGGAAIGASFLLASFVTDRTLVRAIDGWRAAVPAPTRVLRWLGRLGGVVGLVAVVAVGLFGPPTQANLAILVVWAGWWAGYTITTYIVGNTWPALNPWRTLADALPSLDRAYPRHLGAWPATVSLLALVWVEIVNPLAESPQRLAALVVAYTAVTLAGAAIFGSDDWFDHADPIARVFRCYGHVAPLARTPGRDGAIELRLPGSGLRSALRTDDVFAGPGAVPFVIALLWVTTFDGFVATPAWRELATGLVEAGLPGPVLYPLGMAVGFVAFLAVYRYAVGWSRRTGETLLAEDSIARAFAPSLVAIAAGYHLAHFLGYFLTLAPGLVFVAVQPFTPVETVPTLALPPWFETVGMAFVLLGHLLAVWVAHATAFERVPDRMAAIRSQYPIVAVMVLYTVTSLWIVAQPEVAVPYT